MTSSPSPPPLTREEVALRRRAPLQIPNQVVEWLHRSYVVEDRCQVPKAALYDAYEEFCRSQKIRPKPPNVFGKIIKQVYPHVGTSRMGSHLHQVPYYTGLAPRVHASNGPTTPDKSHSSYHRSTSTRRSLSPSSPSSSSPSSASSSPLASPPSSSRGSPVPSSSDSRVLQPQPHNQSSGAHVTLSHSPSSPFTTASTILTTTTTFVNRQLPITPVTPSGLSAFGPFHSTAATTTTPSMPYPFPMGPSPFSCSSSSSSPLQASPSAMHASCDPRYASPTPIRAPPPPTAPHSLPPLMPHALYPNAPSSSSSSMLRGYPSSHPPEKNAGDVRSKTAVPMTEEDRMLQSIKEKFLSYHQPVHVK